MGRKSRTLKTLIEEDLKITGKWSRTDNNGGFHTIKAEGALISFYPGTKTLNVQGAKMEIVRKKLFDMKNVTDGEVSANHAGKTVELDSEDNEDEHERGQRCNRMCPAPRAHQTKTTKNLNSRLTDMCARA